MMRTTFQIINHIGKKDATGVGIGGWKFRLLKEKKDDMYIGQGWKFFNATSHQ
jgi:hypothetical protein